MPKPLYYTLKFSDEREKENFINMMDNLKHKTGHDKRDLLKEGVAMMYYNRIKGVDYYGERD